MDGALAAATEEKIAVRGKRYGADVHILRVDFFKQASAGVVPQVESLIPTGSGDQRHGTGAGEEQHGIVIV